MRQTRPVMKANSPNLERAVVLLLGLLSFGAVNAAAPTSPTDASQGGFAAAPRGGVKDRESLNIADWLQKALSTANKGGKFHPGFRDGVTVSSEIKFIKLTSTESSGKTNVSLLAGVFFGEEESRNLWGATISGDLLSTDIPSVARVVAAGSSGWRVKNSYRRSSLATVNGQWMERRQVMPKDQHIAVIEGRSAIDGLGSRIIAQDICGRPIRRGTINIEVKEDDRGNLYQSYLPKTLSANAEPDIEVTEQLIELADIRKADVVYDIGCGDGRTVALAALRHGCKGIGFELDVGAISLAQQAAKKMHVARNVQFKVVRTFTGIDVSSADVVMLFLLPEMSEKLLPQLKKLKPGARIVSQDFAVPGLEPERTTKSLENGNEHVIYLYRSPLNIQ